MYSFIKEGDASNFYLPASNIFLTIVCELSVQYELKNLTKAHFSHTFCSPSAWIEDLLTTLTTKSESIKQELNWEFPSRIPFDCNHVSCVKFVYYILSYFIDILNQ